MATIVFCWELGGGLGHVAPYLKVADHLTQRGHRVAFILRQTERTARLFQQRGYFYLQAPVPADTPANRIKTPCSYAHVLYNCGYHDPVVLLGLVRTWRALFKSIRPDLVIGEHAPTAMLASLGLDTKRITIGNGFALPPDVYPLPNLRTWLDVKLERLQRDEDGVCAIINRVLGVLKVDPLERVGALFRTDGNILRTLREFDPYQRDAATEYWATPLTSVPNTPEWPSGDGPRVFAYLKASTSLGPLFQTLADLRLPTLIVSDGIPPRLQQRYTNDTMRFSSRPVNMRLAREQCDIAIINGNLNSTINLLRGGKPLLLLPLHLEHYLTTRKVEQLGAGLDISRLHGENLANKLNTFVASESYRNAAAAFAARYADLDPDTLQERMVERIENLLLSRPSPVVSTVH